MNSGYLKGLTFQSIFDKAQEAGREAATNHKPTPMVVVEHANPLDDNSPVSRVFEPVMDGVCGFAWVNVKPGNCSFAKWLKSKGYGRTDSYYGGVTIWISDYNQSYERKMKHAGAMARVLTDYGLRAYSDGRLD